MRNIKLVFEYDGTDFHGYQIQKKVRTVQGEIQKIVSNITNEPVKLIGAARTDTGVHALGQVANFHTSSSITIPALHKGLNALCPDDISILSVQEVPETFHARFSALSRSYVYAIYNNPIPSVFKIRYSVHVPGPLHVRAMFEAVTLLVGEHDFSSFRAASDATRHSVRRMIEAEGKKDGECIFFYFKANAFLQRMIRNIVGTLLLVGRGKVDSAGFKAILESRDRKLAGPTAPPHGLCLLNVEYPDSPAYRNEGMKRHGIPDCWG